MEILGYLLTGAAAAAIVKLLDNLLQWILSRADKKAEKDDAVEKSNEELIKDIEKKVDAIAVGQRHILLDRIRYLGCTCIKARCVTFEDRRILNQMHDTYHNGLGGNGDLNALMDEVNSLPLKQ